MKHKLEHRKLVDEEAQAKKKKWTKRVLLALALLLVAGAALGGYLYFKPKGPLNLTVSTMPPLKGDLVIPWQDTKGNPLCQPVYDGSEVSEGTASKEYEPSDCVQPEKPVLSIPVIGACPIESSGALGAPSDWTKACSHLHDEGGIAYLGHSLRGPRTGALENIHKLEVGDLVEVGKLRYRVANVNQFPILGLPSRIWQEGHFSLITCYVDSAAEAGGPIIANTVVELTDA